MAVVMLYVSRGGKGKEAEGEEKEGGRGREDQGEEEVGKEANKEKFTSKPEAHREACAAWMQSDARQELLKEMTPSELKRRRFI